jgi:hypothetical protein
MSQTLSQPTSSPLNVSGTLSSMVAAPSPASPQLGGLPQIPVDPQFQRQMQVESGNRQFAANGDPLIPPKFQNGDPLSAERSEWNAPVGVSQVRPTTAQEAFKRAGQPFDYKRLETDKQYNEQAGQLVRDQLKVKYQNNGLLTNAAYNAGPGVVDKLVAQLGVPGKDISPQEFAKHLPVETQGYLFSTGVLQGSYSANEPQMPFDMKKTWADVQRKMYGAEAEGSAELGKIQTELAALNVKPPRAEQTPPEQVWGSLAMAVAAFGGLLTHTPVTTSLNAMAGVMDAFHKGDIERTKQEMDRWQASQDSLKTIINYRMKVYEEAMKKMATAPKEAEAMMSANAASLQDTAVQEAINSGDMPKALAITQGGFAAWQKMDQEAQKTKQSLDDRIEMHGLQMQRYEAQKAGDAAKVSEIDQKITDLLQRAQLGSGKATGSLAPKPGTTAQSLEAIKADIRAAHPDWSEGQIVEQANNELARSKQVTLSDDAIEMTVNRMLAGDQNALLGLGRSPANMVKVNDVLAKKMKDGDISALELADRQAEAKAYIAGTRTLATRTANMSVAASEAEQFAPLVKQLSDKVSRSDYPTINEYTIKAMQASGNTDVVRYGQAINALIYSYAKFLNPTGIPTDADKAKSTEILNTAWSKGQINAAVDQIMREIQVGKQGLVNAGEETKEIHDAKMGGQKPVVSAPSAPTPGPDPALGLGPAPPPPAIGSVIDGYKYKGGDPADMKSWEKQ